MRETSGERACSAPATGRLHPDIDRERHPASPWLKLGYAIGTPVVAAVYWQHYGPRNYLWLSDIALASTALSVITDRNLFASMAAVGVLPLELAWCVDFASGGRLVGLSGYMFKRDLPLDLRALSLFHLALPPTLFRILRDQGYARRALPAQVAVTWAALAASYAVTTPEENINWVLGPGEEPQRTLPPLNYLGIQMLLIPVAVILPMHLLLRRVFPSAPERQARSARRNRS